MGSTAKPLHLTVGERGDQEEMKNKSQSRGCAEGWLQRGVVFVGQGGLCGGHRGRRGLSTHIQTWLCKGKGKGQILCKPTGEQGRSHQGVCILVGSTAGGSTGWDLEKFTCWWPPWQPGFPQTQPRAKGWCLPALLQPA